MGLDSSIYNNLLRAPKSIAEYDAEAMQGQTNRLALQMDQAKMNEYQRGVADEQQMRGVVSKFGADKAANYNALLGTGRLKDAQAYEKSNADLGKTTADTAKTTADAQETLIKSVNLKMGQARDMFSTIQTPQQAAQLVQGMYADPDLGKLFAMKGDTAEAAIARIPQDPAKFAEWVQAASLNAEKLASYRTPDANAKLQAQTSTDNNASTNATSRANNASNNAVQIRGQNQAAATAAAGRGQSAQQFSQRLAFDKTKPIDGSAKPMPATALKMQQAELEAIGIAGGIQADLGAIEKQISSGKLDFGPINNLVDKGRNLAGISTEQSRNKASFKSSLEKLRNDSLRLNTGVQTDGDAQRAWSELFENINDKGVVTQRLAEIKKLNERAVKLRKMNVDGIRANYGRDSMDTTGYEKQEPALGGNKGPNIEALLDKYKD